MLWVTSCKDEHWVTRVITSEVPDSSWVIDLSKYYIISMGTRWTNLFRLNNFIYLLTQVMTWRLVTTLLLHTVNILEFWWTCNTIPDVLNFVNCPLQLSTEVTPRYTALESGKSQSLTAETFVLSVPNFSSSELNLQHQFWRVFQILAPYFYSQSWPLRCMACLFLLCMWLK